MPNDNLKRLPFNVNDIPAWVIDRACGKNAGFCIVSMQDGYIGIEHETEKAYLLFVQNTFNLARCTLLRCVNGICPFRRMKWCTIWTIRKMTTTPVRTTCTNTEILILPMQCSCNGLIPHCVIAKIRGTLSRVPLFLWKKLWRFCSFFMEKPWRKCGDFVCDP